MNEVVCDDIVSMVIKLTPDIEIYLDGLGHVLKNGFDLYKSNLGYLDFFIKWQLTWSAKNILACVIKEISHSMKILHLIKSTLFNPRFFASNFKPTFPSMEHEQAPKPT